MKIEFEIGLFWKKINKNQWILYIQNFKFGGKNELDVIGEPPRKARKKGCGLILGLPG